MNPSRVWKENARIALTCAMPCTLVGGFPNPLEVPVKNTAGESDTDSLTPLYKVWLALKLEEVAQEHGEELVPKQKKKKSENKWQKPLRFLQKQLHRNDHPKKNEEGASDLKNLSMLQRLAVNALDLSAPASKALLSQYQANWVQLSGHPDSLCPAGPGTLWKKRVGNDSREREVYQDLMKDPVRAVVPEYFREVQYNNDYFIEMQDLVYEFNQPHVMDIKLGTRTFLECEVTNTQPRPDLYKKMISVDPTAPTPEENMNKAVTKLRYMVFREMQSSSSSLGFRIEAMKKPNWELVKEQFKKTKYKSEIKRHLRTYMADREGAARQFCNRLKYIRSVVESSPFLFRNEVIGSSILLVYNHSRLCAWLIDFTKTVPLPDDVTVSHRDPWRQGNHEEGFLTGIDNLILIFEELALDEETAK